jgi:hypothetical protein
MAAKSGLPKNGSEKAKTAASLQKPPFFGLGSA